jgi:hypothetical protein
MTDAAQWGIANQMSKWRTSIVLVVAGFTAAACSAATPAPAPPPAPSVGTAIVPTKAKAQLFVAPSGSDDNAGTQAEPLQSIEGAAKMAKPGTEVVVQDGTYNGAITTDANGTADARITFRAANRGAAKIVGNGDADAAWENDGDYVDIDGFDITGSNTDGLLSGGSFVRLVNNDVHDFHDGNCITTANDNYDLHDIDVMGNIAARCGASELDHGIYVSHPNGVVANNISFGNAGFGIQCWHACNSLAISNNLVFGNAAGGIVIGQGDGPNNGEVNADNFVVSNNIALDNGRDGIRESGATGPNNQFINNILWNNGTKRINLKSGSQSGTKMVDPGFVNFQLNGSGDYHLKAGSPAIGAGVQLGAPAVDFDGNPRPQEGGVDIGPFQQQ